MKLNFRTHQQMHDIYGDRHENGLSELPYLLQYENKKEHQILIFNGTKHSNKPQAPEYPVVLENWQKFTTNKNPKKIVMCEGQVRNIHGKTMNDAIISDGDSGLACWLANSEDYDLISPEPDRDKEIEKLVAKHGPDKTFLYYFARQMHQWARGDFKTRTDWKEYATSWVENFRERPFGIDGLNLDKAMAIFEKETGQEFSWLPTKTMHKISDPYSNPVATDCGNFRDECIYSSIRDYWINGYSIFIVFGSGHAIVMEPALDKLPNTIKI